MAGFYNDKVIDHFKNPRNVGVIKNPDAVGYVGEPVWGIDAELYLRIENGVVTEAKSDLPPIAVPPIELVSLEIGDAPVFVPFKMRLLWLFDCQEYNILA